MNFWPANDSRGDAVDSLPTSAQFHGVKSLTEIEEAIARLPADAQRQLLKDIPALCPTVFPRSGWEQILQDKNQRPELSTLLDRLDAEYTEAPERFLAVNEDTLHDPKG